LKLPPKNASSGVGKPNLYLLSRGGALIAVKKHIREHATNLCNSRMAAKNWDHLSYALGVRNFADNPEQAMLTAAGTYVGEAIGAAFGGPIGAAIGGAIGGFIGGALATTTFPCAKAWPMRSGMRAATCKCSQAKTQKAVVQQQLTVG
jgi:hypothetical protein